MVAYSWVFRGAFSIFSDLFIPFKLWHRPWTEEPDATAPSPLPSFGPGLFIPIIQQSAYKEKVKHLRLNSLNLFRLGYVWFRVYNQTLDQNAFESLWSHLEILTFWLSLKFNFTKRFFFFFESSKINNNFVGWGLFFMSMECRYLGTYGGVIFKQFLEISE